MTTFETAMAQSARLAALSDLLPDTGMPSHGWRARFSWLTRLSRRRPRGLEAIPERYRLQFLVLAADALPGRAPEDVAAMAGRLADSVRIPGRLLAQLPDTDGLDRWFKSEAEAIAGRLDGLLSGAS